MAIRLLFRLAILAVMAAACAPAQVAPTAPPTVTDAPVPTRTQTPMTPPSPLPTDTPPPPTATRRPTTTPRPTQDVFPTGRFEAPFGESRLALIFEEDGRFEVYFGARRLDAGTYTVSGYEVVVDTEVCSRENAGAGTYQWSYDGEALVLATTTPDPCDHREEIMRRKYTRAS